VLFSFNIINNLKKRISVSAIPIDQDIYDILLLESFPAAVFAPDDSSPLQEHGWSCIALFPLLRWWQVAGQVLQNQPALLRILIDMAFT
jgi:hypothetical protein